MKIGIHDDMFYSLQAELLNEGNELYCYVPVDIPRECFNVTGVKTDLLHHVRDYTEFLLADYDMYIIGTGPDKQSCYETLKTLYPNKVICGHSDEACQLEYNRELANYYVSKTIAKSLLKVPKSKAFTNKDDAVSWLRKQNKTSWVAKQHNTSPLDTNANRTMVSKAGCHEQLISIIQKEDNAWFNKDSTGGIVFEQFIEGNEVCFGSWFNGEQFSPIYYVCEEHKGAQSNDRGRLLTGEVGTWLSWQTSDKKIKQIFNQLAPLFKGKCNGMIDFNTILTEKGELYFVEFTVRFGRPTLELMLATSENVSSQLMNGYSHYNDFKYNSCVGVTVFSYGIPLVKDEHAIPSIPFNLPDIDLYYSPVNEISFQQLFCTHNPITNTWMTSVNDRQFTVCSSFNSDTSSVSTQNSNVLQSLENFDTLGLTWREDVGINALSILNTLIKKDFI